MPEKNIVREDAQRNEDWLRSRTWDIIPATAENFLGSLGVRGKTQAQQKQAVADFMKLPAAAPMPEELKQELKGRGLL